MSSNIQQRIDRLKKDARKITWKPDTLLLTGQEGAYRLEIREWDGTPGSARDGTHTKAYSFTDKAEAMAFVEEMTAYWARRFSIPRSDLILLDFAIPTDAERAEAIQKVRPLVLETIAEREGVPLESKLREIYGEDTDPKALPVWGDIIREKKAGNALFNAMLRGQM